jgi:hypothetical protein
MSKTRECDPDCIYDEYRDRIGSSEDFKNCVHKDDDDYCLLEKPITTIYGEYKSKCWHVWFCPAGYGRK